MTIACFQIAGISEWFRERLKRSVRYCRPRGPRCWRCRMVRPSGPAARELPPFLMARETMKTEKGLRLWLSRWDPVMERLSLRVSGVCA